MKAESIRLVSAGVSTGLIIFMIGAAMYSTDKGGLIYLATLAFIFAIIATSDTVVKVTKQLFCKHEYAEIDQMGLVVFECKHCKKTYE